MGMGFVAPMAFVNAFQDGLVLVVGMLHHVPMIALGTVCVSTDGVNVLLGALEQIALGYL